MLLSSAIALGAAAAPAAKVGEHRVLGFTESSTAPPVCLSDYIPMPHTRIVQGLLKSPAALVRQPLSRTTRPYAQSPPTNMHSICATPSGISAWSLCAAWPIQTGAFSGVHSTKRPTQGKRPSGVFAGNHRHCLRLRRHRPHHCLCRRLVRREKKATSVCGPSPTSAAPRKARSSLARIGTAAVSTTALAACSLTSA